MTKNAINLETVDFLLSSRGRMAARELADADLSESQTLTRLQELRQTFTPQEAGALLALARLRQSAGAKFPQPEALFFTQEALEQATATTVAAHRAAWIAEHATPGPVLDLGCGIGGDTLALAQRRPVIAFERDPIRLEFARANVAVQGLSDRVTFYGEDWASALQAGRLPGAAAAFVDPARRQGGRRIFSLHELIPPLAVIMQLRATIPALAVKVMPGVQDDELPADCSVEFISHAGVCKEAILWFGPFARHPRWASVHQRDRHDVEHDADHGGMWHMLVSAGAQPPVGPLEPEMILYEPDPAVIRAGAFAELCALLQGHLFDPQIAYLVSTRYTPSPFVHAFVLHEIHPFGLKLLNQRLQALDIGHVELKKRGVPFAPEELRGRLRLAESPRAGVVLFTRQQDRRLMLIAERIT